MTYYEIRMVIKKLREEDGLTFKRIMEALESDYDVHISDKHINKMYNTMDKYLERRDTLYGTIGDVYTLRSKIAELIDSGLSTDEVTYDLVNNYGCKLTKTSVNDHYKVYKYYGKNHYSQELSDDDLEWIVHSKLKESYTGDEIINFIKEEYNIDVYPKTIKSIVFNLEKINKLLPSVTQREYIDLCKDYYNMTFDEIAQLVNIRYNKSLTRQAIHHTYKRKNKGMK